MCTGRLRSIDDDKIMWFKEAIEETLTFTLKFLIETDIEDIKKFSYQVRSFAYRPNRVL